jgi:hypothetical protein
LAVGISRFASALDGLVRGWLDVPEFVRLVQCDLRDGQHRNPTNRPEYFTTAFFHHPDELKAEVEEAGLRHDPTVVIEGPGGLLQNFAERWNDPGRRERLLNVIRRLAVEHNRPRRCSVSPRHHCRAGLASTGQCPFFRGSESARVLFDAS